MNADARCPFGDSSPNPRETSVGVVQRWNRNPDERIRIACIGIERIVPSPRNSYSWILFQGSEANFVSKRGLLCFLSCGERDGIDRIKASHCLFRERHSGRTRSIDARQVRHVDRNSAPLSPSAADAELDGDKACTLFFQRSNLM